MLMPNGPAAWVGLELRRPGRRARHGQRLRHRRRGASSLGLDIIRSGRADVVVAGGTEAAIHPLPIAGFAQMRAMSTRNDEPEKASRPLDKGRDGFVLGEGAGVARARAGRPRRAPAARRIYARLAGAGITSDAYDIVQPAPARARAASARCTKALRDAGLTGADIAHVNAHATSTPVGDMAEIIGIKARVRRPPGGDFDQVDDRPPARRGRGRSSRSPPSWRSGTASFRRRSTSTTRTTSSTSTWPRTRPARWRSTPP